MAVKWFLNTGDRTEGPFLSEDVQSRYASGQLSRETLIWGTGESEWRNIAIWARDAGVKTSALEPDPGGTKTVAMTSVNADPTMVMGAGVSAAVNAEPEIGANEVWHFASGGKSFGPMNRGALLAELRKIEQLGEVVLWTKGMKEWVSVFEFHEILTALGITKRASPRAEIQGSVVIKTEKGASATAPLLNISEGGLSIAITPGIKSGMVVDLEITSESLGAPITTKADVRFAANGMCGIRFQALSAEAKATISKYIADQIAAITQSAA